MREIRAVATFSQAIQRIAVGAVLVATLAACSPSPSPTPVASAAPSAEPSASPVVDAVPSPSPGPSSEPGVQPSAGLPSGWDHEIACNHNGRRCRLHLYDEREREVPGWPVALADGCWGNPPATATDGTAYVVCSGKTGVIVHAFDTRGRAVDGWPVPLDGRDSYASWNTFDVGSGATPSLRVTNDGSVVIGTNGPRRSWFRLTALSPNGRTRPGWPVDLPGHAQGFDVANDGSVVAWWYEGYEPAIQLVARRTVFTRLDARGRTETGWPVGSQGAASGPLMLDDGGIIYTTETGRVWRHDRDGDVVDGWPFQLPEAVAPRAHRDQLVFVGRSWVTVLDDTGREAEGWPWRAGGSLVPPGCDTPGSSYVPTVWSPNGTLYLTRWSRRGSAIVALDRRGRVKPGWPFRLPQGWVAFELLASGDGVTAMLGGLCEAGGERTEVTLEGDGRTDDTIPMWLQGVYAAMRPDGLRTTDGRTVITRGDEIEGTIDYVNTSRRQVTLPLAPLGIESAYTMGFEQAWLMRLGADPTIECLPDQRPRRGWYRTGSEIIKYLDPMTIPAGGSIVRRWRLSRELTGCLPAGEYSYRIDYRMLSSDGGRRIASETLDFVITERP
jgi:hypothetical protein